MSLYSITDDPDADVFRTVLEASTERQHHLEHEHANHAAASDGGMTEEDGVGASPNTKSERSSAPGSDTSNKNIKKKKKARKGKARNRKRKSEL